VCAGGFRAAQAKLWQHNLDKMRIKCLENDVSVGREEGGGAQASSGRSAATHMSHGPDCFTKDLMVMLRHCLNSANHLGSNSTTSHPYVASNIAARRLDSTACRGGVSFRWRNCRSTQTIL
jgi:hypothetical protein